MNELVALLSSMEVMPDVLVLTETWLSSVDSCYANISGYDAYHTVRERDKSGGVSIFCSSRYDSCQYRDLSMCSTNIEACCIKISFMSICLNVVGIYRPHLGTIEQFVTELKQIVETDTLGRRERICIAGDFNVNLLLESNDSVTNFITCMHSCHFVPMIKHPTRFPIESRDAHPTLIDHIWVNFLIVCVLV